MAGIVLLAVGLIPEARRLVDQDESELAKTAATGTPEPATHRLAGEKEVLAKPKRDLADTIHYLTEVAEAIATPTDTLLPS